MRRRQFLQSSGIVGVSALPQLTCLNPATAQQPVPDAPAGLASDSSGHAAGLASDTVQTWHFHDLWRLDQCDQLVLKQGTATWQEDAVYLEPPIGSLSAWPTVWRDPDSGRWKMWYSANWKPYCLMIADSEDGRHWQPLAQPDIHPVGPKLAPHHLFTLPGGSGGSVYVDPEATDGWPLKVFVHQRGPAVLARAQADPAHRWHQIARTAGEAKRYLVEDFTLVSRDGLHWHARRDLAWSGANWHPEPPLFGFFNTRLGRHQMTVRPGWGDRRQCLQWTSDFRTWSGPQLLLQPDALDEKLIEFYGMPVFPYGDGYVGLLWIFHTESPDPPQGFNRFLGPLDCQLAFSADGVRFNRGLRTPLIRRNPPGEHGSGAIQPSCLVETPQELRIYSAATKLLHGQGRTARQRGIDDNASILLHTLRKDGLMFLEATGHGGHFLSKPLVLLSDQLEINLRAPHGEAVFQITDLSSRPVEGFTFSDCVPLRAIDQLKAPLRWKAAQLQQLLGRIVRLEVRLEQAQLFALRGKMHFIDAQDRWLLEDGQPIVT